MIQAIANGLTRHDDIYARLIAAHDGLSEEASRKLNAKLILALANHVGNAEDVLALIDTIAGTDDSLNNTPEPD
jgi:hypothetical protein